MEKIRQISYTLVANLLGTLVSALITFVLPKMLGVTEYGYFQLYIFYYSYVGLLHFGWADGIFLRYGGVYYEQLDKSSFHAQIRLYGIVQIAISAVLMAAVMIISPGEEKSWVFGCTCFVAVFTNLYFLQQYILQATGRIKEYAAMLILEKIVYVVLVAIFFILNEKGFVAYIIAHITGVIAAVALGFWYCREILQAKPVAWRLAVKESGENLRAGMKLMLANLASQMIIGIVGQSIEIRWGVEQFGVLSLSLAVSNMLMLLINAVAVVLFPMLRRMDQDRLIPMYRQLRSMLMIPLFGLLIFYYPGKEILSHWLPQYAKGLEYLGLLFPICVFESKMSMLVNTYLKALRKEKLIMYVNMISVGLSLVMSLAAVFVFENMIFAVVSIVILLAFRSVLAEVLLSKQFHLVVWPDIVAEILMVVMFIVGNWTIKGISGTLVYMAALVVYLAWKRKELGELILILRRRKIYGSEK